MSPHENYDVAIVGAGMVGASIAYHLGAGLRVLLLEAEEHAGTHASGRSAALYFPAYGPPMVRALTRASRAFFVAPPEGFAAVPLLAPRGILAVGRPGQEASGRDMMTVLGACGGAPQWLDARAVAARVPALRESACAFGVYDADAWDIDVDALLQGLLRGARRHGAELRTGARLVGLERIDGWWLGRCERGPGFAAKVVVNAAGAWADQVAAVAGLAGIGIEPRRRSAFLFAPPAGVDPRAWPAVIALDESWYFKPDAGMLLGSPANADLTVPHDVVPEELDIATGIDRIERATTMTIRRPARIWAGLRSFVADGEPVLGADPACPGFFWAAALGGYGIQTAPAVGRLCAAWLRGEPVPAPLQEVGIDAAALRPARAPAAGA